MTAADSHLEESAFIKDFPLWEESDFHLGDYSSDSDAAPLSPEVEKEPTGNDFRFGDYSSDSDAGAMSPLHTFPAIDESDVIVCEPPFPAQSESCRTTLASPPSYPSPTQSVRTSPPTLPMYSTAFNTRYQPPASSPHRKMSVLTLEPQIHYAPPPHLLTPPASPANTTRVSPFGLTADAMALRHAQQLVAEQSLSSMQSHCFQHGVMVRPSQHQFRHQVCPSHFHHVRHQAAHRPYPQPEPTSL
ncbi:hypothetical protein HK097_000674, partial [Rhizophlyctis rosea]